MQNKPKLLLLHGALGAKEQFSKLQEYLSTDFDVLTFNFSGHGGKPFSENFSIDTFADEVLNFLNENNIEKIDLFGYSMGGYVALNLALKAPEKIGKIFTLGTKLKWSPKIAAKEVKMLNPEIIEEKVPKFAAALQKRHAPNDWKVLLKKTAEMMTALGNGEGISNETFPKINHQVIVGIGELDSMVSYEETETVANLLPNGKLQFFNGFKHPIEQVDIKKLAESILLFFKETNLQK